MTDLPDRILEAIAETARIATATTDLPVQAASARWEVEPIRVAKSAPRTAMVCRVNGNWVAFEMTAKDAEHIVHNDPLATLRRCEADKRTVELHVPNSSVIADSPFVDAGGNRVPPCKHCRWSWPCPDLLDRAAAYDIEAS